MQPSSLRLAVQRGRSVWRRATWMPPLRASASRISYTPVLVAYWLGVLIVASLAVATSSVAKTNFLAAGLLAVAAFIADYFSVSAVADIDVAWSTSVFVFLVAVLTTGTVGVAIVAVAAACGHALRYRVGWFRASFNAASHTFECYVALAVFGALKSNLMLAGIAVGLTDLVTNTLLLMGAIGISTRRIDLSFWIRDSLSFLTYELVYGLGAVAAYTLYATQKELSYFEILGTPFALQAFMVLLARRIHRFNLETREHQEARVRLLQQAIDASNTERERIAASIHDGVVQDLVGLTFTLGAFADRDIDDLSPDDKAELLGHIKEGSETARQATRDLRTLMVEIASPKLKQDGLRAAIEDLLHNISGTLSSELVMPSEMDDLSEAQQALLFRVAQEGIRNASKYSEARRLLVNVSRTAEDILLVIEDDGAGFLPEQRLKRQDEGHVGLTLLERTVRDGGGTLDISSQPGKGTRLMMSVRADPGGQEVVVDAT